MARDDEMTEAEANALSEIELAVLEQSEPCPRCGGQGLELRVGSKTGWTFGYDYAGREIEVEVEMPDVQQVACSASGCWQGRVHPLGWATAFERATMEGSLG